MYEKIDVEHSVEVLTKISQEALAIATELRDSGDGPEKKESLKMFRRTLMASLAKWSKAQRHPIPNSVEETIFRIIYDSRAASGLPVTSRALVVKFARKATDLRIPPGSDSRTRATKFFQIIGEKARTEIEKLFPNEGEASA